MFIQLWHEGAIRKEAVDGPDFGVPTLSPSGLVTAGKSNGRAASLRDLADIRDGFRPQPREVPSCRRVEITRATGTFSINPVGLTRIAGRRLWCDEILRARSLSAEVVMPCEKAVEATFDLLPLSQWKEIGFDAKIVPKCPQDRGRLAARPLLFPAVTSPDGLSVEHRSPVRRRLPSGSHPRAKAA